MSEMSIFDFIVLPVASILIGLYAWKKDGQRGWQGWVLIGTGLVVVILYAFSGYLGWR